MNKFLIKNVDIFFVFILCLFFSSIATAQIPGSMTSSDDLIIPEMTNENKSIGVINDPCPDPKKALENTPNDLIKIQEDITRFNLCLKRAQLLSRLNDLALDNLETLNSSMDVKIEEIVNRVQPIEFPDFASQMTVPENYETNIVNANEKNYESDDWKISSIKGVSGELIATVSDDNGNIFNVKRGEKIPETNILIDSVNQVSVHVIEHKEKRKLSWN